MCGAPKTCASAAHGDDSASDGCRKTCCQSRSDEHCTARPSGHAHDQENNGGDHEGCGGTCCGRNRSREHTRAPHGDDSASDGCRKTCCQSRSDEHCTARPSGRAHDQENNGGDHEGCSGACCGHNRSREHTRAPHGNDSASDGCRKTCCQSRSDEHCTARPSGHAHDQENNGGDYEGCGGACCGRNRSREHTRARPVSEIDDKCCSKELCICDELCEFKYAHLLHEQSGCKRTKMVTLIIEKPVHEPESIATTLNKRIRSSCSHCLDSARKVALSLDARACYCELTRSLSRSVKSLAAMEFASGCCNRKPNRQQIQSCGNCTGHDHDHSASCADEEGTSTPAFSDAKLETGPCYSHRLALGVSGMHCSSCADELAKILGNILGVDRNAVKVSFIMSRAELKYDPAVIRDSDKDIRGRMLKRFPRLDVVVLSDSEVDEEELNGIMKVRIQSESKGSEALRGIALGLSGVVSAVSTSGVEIELAYDPDNTGIRNILAILESQTGGVDIELTDIPDGAVAAQVAEKKYNRRIAFQTIAAGIFTIPILVLAWSGDKIKVKPVTRYSVEFSMATAIIIVARTIYLDAIRSLCSGLTIDMDVLVSVATGAAYIFSVAVFGSVLAQRSEEHPLGQEPFFETSALLTTLILAGRWMTASVRSWASRRVRSIGDMEMQASTVRLYDPVSKEERSLDVRRLHYGDVILASQGEKVATDGLIIEGTGQMDESHLTGEPKPQTKSEGSFILAGSKVVSGEVRYRVSKLAQENTIATIKNMVKLASQQKPRVQEIADKIASYLTPAILLISSTVFLIWLLVEALKNNMGWSKSAVSALTYAVATLAISCPCAIGLAVPMVLVVASRIGVSKGGFVFRNPAAIEKGTNVGAVIFDKTGTLTTGQLQVESSWIQVGGVLRKQPPDARILAVLRTLCRTSNHPVAKAMNRFAEELAPSSEGINLSLDVTTVVSKGIETTIAGAVYRGGRLSYTAPDTAKDAAVVAILESAQSIFTLSRDFELIAIFGLKDDAIRQEVPHVLENLRKRGIELYIFSGDRPEAVFPVAKELGIPRTNVYGDCYPEDKRARLEVIKKRMSGAGATMGGSTDSGQSLLERIKAKLGGQRKNIVFVGDGTNDAVALMAADIGVSLSQSTDMAASSADVSIISDSIVGLVSFLELSRRVNVCIAINFTWAILWNIVAILGASGGWGPIRISPEWAGLGEIASVCPVFIVSWAVGWGYRSG